MPFQKEYLKRTLAIVDGLASISSKQVIENIYNSYDGLLILIIASKHNYFERQKMLNGIKTSRLKHYYIDGVNLFENPHSGRFVFLKKLVSLFFPSCKNRELKSFIENRFFN